jgi:hypothetical protein
MPAFQHVQGMHAGHYAGMAFAAIVIVVLILAGLEIVRRKTNGTDIPSRIADIVAPLTPARGGAGGTPPAA